MPTAFNGRTLTQVAINQGAAGSTDLVGAPGAGLRIYVVNMVLVADGAATVKFTEGAGTALTGAISLSANGGLSAPGNSENSPVLITNTANSKLTLVSTTSAIKGWFIYFIAE